MEAVLTEEFLMKDTGFTSRGRLVKWLQDQGIPYRVGNKQRICGVTVRNYEAGKHREATYRVRESGPTVRGSYRTRCK